MAVFNLNSTTNGRKFHIEKLTETNAFFFIINEHIFLSFSFFFPFLFAKMTSFYEFWLKNPICSRDVKLHQKLVLTFDLFTKI